MTKSQAIMEAVCLLHQVTVDELTGQRRSRSIAHPRQLAMTATMDYGGLSSSQTGRLYGGRDHTTVLHARNAVAKRGEEQQVAQIIKTAKTIFTQGGGKEEVVKDPCAKTELSLVRRRAQKLSKAVEAKDDQVSRLMSQNRTLRRHVEVLEDKLLAAKRAGRAPNEMLALRERVDFLEEEADELRRELSAARPYLPYAKSQGLLAYTETDA